VNQTEWTAPGMGDEVITLADFIEMNREDRLELPMLARTDLEIVGTGRPSELDIIRAKEAIERALQKRGRRRPIKTRISGRSVRGRVLPERFRLSLRDVVSGRLALFGRESSTQDAHHRAVIPFVAGIFEECALSRLHRKDRRERT